MIPIAHTFTIRCPTGYVTVLAEAGKSMMGDDSLTDDSGPSQGLQLSQAAGIISIR